MKIVQPVTITDSVLVSSNIVENDYTTWSSSTVYKAGDRVRVVSTDVHKVYESATGSSSTVTMTIASPCVVSWVGHGLAVDTPIVFTTTGALPTGLVAGTVYYALAPTANTFNVAATIGGTAINTTGTQSGVHTATASKNYNKDPSTNPLDSNGNPIWLDAGSTNRWKMFDQSVQSQSSRASSIEVDLLMASYIDTVAILNVSASTVQVKVTHPVDGVIYDKTVTLTSYLGVVDWYTYFYEDINVPSDVLFTGIPRRPGCTVEVNVNKTTGDAMVGTCILGVAKDISSEQLGVEAGARVSIDDYSVKERDDFGNYMILERSFNKRADVTVVVDSNKVDYVVNLLSKLRATPILYVGSTKYTSLLLYGFYKNFEVDIAYDTISYCTLQLEGLT